MSKNTFFTPQRLAVDGILTALFFVLSLFSFEIMGVKVTFDALPVILCAMLFGPTDALIVGFLGAFLEQMVHYGFTVTTLLWVIPPALRGLALGLFLLPIRKKMPIANGKGLNFCFIFAIIAGIITSVGNTFVYYFDSKLYGYYNYALVFGAFIWRLLTGIVMSVLCCLAAAPIVAALQKSRLIHKKEF